MSAQISADLILVNGRIWTVNPAQPEVEAVACLGGRIVALGRSDDIRKLAGSGTRIVDLGGRRVVPGFNDAHVHFHDGGRGLSSVQLRDARAPEAYLCSALLRLVGARDDRFGQVSAQLCAPDLPRIRTTSLRLALARRL